MGLKTTISYFEVQRPNHESPCYITVQNKLDAVCSNVIIRSKSPSSATIYLNGSKVSELALGEIPAKTNKTIKCFFLISETPQGEDSLPIEIENEVVYSYNGKEEKEIIKNKVFLVRPELKVSKAELKMLDDGYLACDFYAENAGRIPISDLELAVNYKEILQKDDGVSIKASFTFTYFDEYKNSYVLSMDRTNEYNKEQLKQQEKILRKVCNGEKVVLFDETKEKCSLGIGEYKEITCKIKYLVCDKELPPISKVMQ
jgi:hypothetical protein